LLLNYAQYASLFSLLFVVDANLLYQLNMSNNTDATSMTSSADRQFYLKRGEVPAFNTRASSASQNALPPPPQQQQSSQQDGDAGQRLASDPSADLAAFFASQPRTSSAPYQQQKQRVFGQPLQLSVPPQLVLDEEFRAAARKNPMLWGFMQSLDQMAERKGT